MPKLDYKQDGLKMTVLSAHTVQLLQNGKQKQHAGIENISMTVNIFRPGNENQRGSPVIGHAFGNGKGTIQLFQEYDPEHIVSKG